MVRIGFDFDGVISESAIFKSEQIRELYGINLQPWQLTSNVINRFVTDREIRSTINSLSAQTLHPKFVDKKMVELLQKLTNIGAELYIISRRGKSNKGVELGNNTIDELKIRDFFKEIIFCETDDDKVEKIKEKQLDLFIDDRTSVIEGIHKNIHFPILFDEYNLINKGLLKCNEEFIVTNSLWSLLDYVNILSLIKKAIHTLVAEKIIDIPQKHEIVSHLNNIVVKINNLYLKIYNGNSIIKDNELILYKEIKNTKLFKEIIYQGVVKTDKRYDFALFKPIEGKTLDLIEYQDAEAEKIAKKVHEFINYTSKISCNKFGDIDEKFEGAQNSFKEYIFEFQHKTSTTLYLDDSTRKYSSLAYDLLLRYEQKFNVEKPYIIPVDLNFKNIMVTDNFRIKIVDPGALIAGPLEMSYGEFCAHSYGTLIYEKFEKMMGKEVDQELVRIYAIFMLLNILAFIVRNNIMDAKLAKPFGNNKTFLELIDEHLKFLGGEVNVR